MGPRITVMLKYKKKLIFKNIPLQKKTIKIEKQIINKKNKNKIKMENNYNNKKNNKN